MHSLALTSCRMWRHLSIVSTGLPCPQVRECPTGSHASSGEHRLPHGASVLGCSRRPRSSGIASPAIDSLHTFVLVGVGASGHLSTGSFVEECDNCTVGPAHRVGCCAEDERCWSCTWWGCPARVLVDRKLDQGRMRCCACTSGYAVFILEFQSRERTRNKNKQTNPCQRLPILTKITPSQRTETETRSFPYYVASLRCCGALLFLSRLLCFLSCFILC